MLRKPSLAILLALVAAHIVLAGWFAAITPFRTAGIIPHSGSRDVQADIGAPDERQHVNYVLGLANEDGFPVFKPDDPNFNETLESHQPPLYYLIAAGWGDVTGATLPQPPPASHSSMSSGDGLRLRSLNVVIGATTVLAVFALVFWGYRNQEAALIAAAFAAFLPMNCGLDGAVSNDPLLICLCTWTLAVTAWSMREGWTTGRALVVGVLAGAAILTKTTGVALLPALLAAAIWPRAPRLTGRQWAAALIPILLMVVPWWARNQSLYGDPLAMRAFNQAFVHTAQAKSFLAEYGPFGYWVDWVGSWTARSFIGVFGYMDIWLTDTLGPQGKGTIYLLAWLVIGVAFVGWLIALRGAKRQGTAGVHALNGIFFLIVLGLFVRFNGQYFQAQGRYLLPAIGPIAAGVGLGLAQLAKDRWMLALVALIAVFGIGDAFAFAKLPAAFQQRAIGPR